MRSRASTRGRCRVAGRTGRNIGPVPGGLTRERQHLSGTGRGTPAVARFAPAASHPPRGPGASVPRIAGRIRPPMEPGRGAGLERLVRRRSAATTASAWLSVRGPALLDSFAAAIHSRIAAGRRFGIDPIDGSTGRGEISIHTPSRRLVLGRASDPRTKRAAGGRVAGIGPRSC